MKIAPFVRKEDRNEIAAATGTTNVNETILLSFDISARCWTIRHQNEKRPFALFGVGDAGLYEGATAGIVWMVATEGLKKHGLAFARISRPWAEKLLEGYDIIFNYVWSGNWLHKRWLAWAGFTVYPPIERGPFGEKFHPFYLLRKDAPTCVHPSPSR